jgi:predicted nucleic acid-binding protein
VGGNPLKLVDTSSWIEYLRNLDSQAGKRVEALVLAEEAGCCEMVLLELWNGARGARERRELAELEREIMLFHIDEQVWTKARQLATRCRDAGITAPAADLTIAACAVRYGLEIEHCDAHFEKILALGLK